MTVGSPKSAAPKRRPRGRPPNEELRERRREQILEKATAVFAARGYPNTDVQDIADPLDISKGTIYRYFPTKERLFLAAVERGVRRLDEAMARAIGAVEDRVERMTVATVTYLGFFEANPALVELFVQERAEFRDLRKPVYFEQGCSGECQWRQDLERLVADGRLRAVPVQRVMDVAGDLLYGTMFRNHFVGRTKPFAEQAADINDVLFNGILSDGERARRDGGEPDKSRNERRDKQNGNGRARNGTQAIRSGRGQRASDN